MITVQQLLEGMSVAQAIWRGDVAVGSGRRRPGTSPHQQARAVVATFKWLAGELRVAS